MRKNFEMKGHRNYVCRPFKLKYYDLKDYCFQTTVKVLLWKTMPGRVKQVPQDSTE